MSTTMTNVRWALEMRFEEDRDHTRATAVLGLPSGREVRGHGMSKRNPVDRPAPRIGEEVSGARALSNLAHELLEYAAGEIEYNVHRDDPTVR